MNDRELSMEEIEKLCQEYDREYGSYPEIELEGQSVYSFICEQLGNEPAMVEGYVEVKWKEAMIKRLSDG